MFFFLNFIRQKTEIGSSRNGSELTDFTFFHKIQTTGYFYSPPQQSPPLALDPWTSTKSYKERVESHGQDLNILAIWHCCGVFVRKPRASAPLTLHFTIVFSDFRNIFVPRSHCSVAVVYFSQIFCSSILQRSVLAVAPETWQITASVLFWLSCNNQVQSRCIKSGVRHPLHVCPMKTSVAFIMLSVCLCLSFHREILCVHPLIFSF